MNEVMEYLERCGYERVFAAKSIAGRRYAAILPHSFGRVRVIVGSLDVKFGFDQQIEFDDLDAACRALNCIDEPMEESACT